ncbi:MAG: UDP-N-acetylglucosamine--N-acetylmuramyl-(pentapeptide) pyrophosphoryl-undecaprenol N-acetylglucosamine transferase [Patescibacteria group bacterium]|nr:UDP-N-acetylglucosamine--N-acetylmuramyl-(pentapeptide) pyrophosphoryl-undecaprenol N-acetylglucosamine transferase [Patescibacteria group bacterium]
MSMVFDKNLKILLTGGGTMGSVMPLVAIMEQMKNDKANHCFLFIITKNGPEKKFLEKKGVDVKPIFSGKFRRYFSFKNFIDPFLILIGFFLSFFIILKFKPDIILSAGSFVSVPVIFAGKILRVPILIHQMDVRKGLANKIMAPFADKITVGFEKSLNDYPKNKTVWTGNPVRKELRITNYELRQPKAGQLLAEIKNEFNLIDNLPTLLVLGGGTGAMAINNLIKNNLEKLTEFCQIIHITGKNKSIKIAFNKKYHSFEFLQDTIKTYAVSDAIVSRCGIGVLSELSAFKKPSILIPISDSHQEENADIFSRADAAIILNQKNITDDIFIETVKKILYNKDVKDRLSKNISEIFKADGTEKIIEIIKTIIYDK